MTMSPIQHGGARTGRRQRCSFRVHFILGSLVLCLSATVDAMQMSVVGNQLIMRGPVIDSDYVRFKDLLRLNRGGIDTVVLGYSIGGDSWTARAIAQIIRDEQLRTAVSAYCRSACTIIFLGGKGRHFTDEAPVAMTYLGFHGTYKNFDHSLMRDDPFKFRYWVLDQTQGKVDRNLLDRWVNMANHKGFVRIFDARRLSRDDGVSVLYCTGAEDPARNSFDQCEKIAGEDAYTMGIVTSAEVIHVNKLPKAAAESTKAPTDQTAVPGIGGAGNSKDPAAAGQGLPASAASNSTVRGD
jgi:hypothetical protein